MLVLITPTGDRQVAFSQCERLMFSQHWEGEVLWIVVDDGKTATKLSDLPERWQRAVIRPKPLWSDGENTQGRNLQEALRAIGEIDVGNPQLLFIEDDDFYDTNWLRAAHAALETHQLVGEAPSRWYNAKTKTYGVEDQHSHASLRCTGIRGEAINAFRESLNEKTPYYDLVLWRKFHGGALLNSAQTIGVKGMPGRRGVTPWHDKAEGLVDISGKMAARWFGVHADFYHSFMEMSPMQDYVECVVKKAFHKYSEGDTVRLTRKQFKIMSVLKKVTPVETSDDTLLAADSDSADGDSDKTETGASTKTAPADPVDPSESNEDGQIRPREELNAGADSPPKNTIQPRSTTKKQKRPV